MTQRALNRRVARATGDSLGTIRRLGFGLADPLSVHHDPEPETVSDLPQVIDWDETAAQRLALFPCRQGRSLAAA